MSHFSSLFVLSTKVLDLADKKDGSVSPLAVGRLADVCMSAKCLPF